MLNSLVMGGYGKGAQPCGCPSSHPGVQVPRALLPLCPPPWDGWDLISVPRDLVVMDTWGMWMWGHGAAGEPGGGLLAGSSSGVAHSVEDVICGLVRHCWRWT